MFDQFRFIDEQLKLAIKCFRQGCKAAAHDMDGEADLMYVGILAALDAARTVNNHVEAFNDGAFSRALQSCTNPVTVEELEELRGIIKQYL